MEEKSIKEITDALGLKELAPQIYQDMLQPVAKELSNSLVTVVKSVSIALAPLEASVWGYGKIKEWLSTKLTAKLAKKNLANIQTPSLIIAGPALLNLCFAAQEEHLREMYANLIATAMDTEISENAHPAFVQILQQMSPDEAKILKILQTYESGELVCEAIYDNYGTVVDREKGIIFQFEEVYKRAGVSNIKKTHSYMENLIRLKILGEYSRSDAKLILEGGNRYGSWETHLDHANYNSIYVTDFGETFINVCVA